MSKNRNEGCIGIILRIFGVEGPVKPTFPYELRDEFLSPAEASFFHALGDCLGPEHSLSAKVRLRSLFQVTSDKFKQAAIERISTEYVDFLVCDRKTMRPLLGVELLDSNDRSDEEKKRDHFIEKVFEAADLPVLHVRSADTYERDELAVVVATAIGEK